MKTSRMRGMLGAVALCSTVLLLPALAAAQDDMAKKALSARQGFMQVVVWEAGPLFGMAKGEVAYDAETAAANAENLDAVLRYSVDRLFIPGTSKSDLPGKTRALSSIWEEPDKFARQYQELRDAAAVLARDAGKGKDAMTAAVQQLGKACGNCHDDFRAEEF